jgi:hypothetical protein
MKFIIKNRPKRKYVRKTSADISFAKPVLIGLLPAILIAAAFLAVTLIKPYSMGKSFSLDIQFDTSRISIGAFLSIVQIILQKILFFTKLYVQTNLDYSTITLHFITVIIGPVLQTLGALAIVLFYDIQTFTDILGKIFLQMIQKITEFLNTLFFILGTPLRVLTQYLNQAKPYRDFILSNLKISTDTLFISFKHILQTGSILTN